MYQLTSAHVRTLEVPGKWVIRDITTIPFVRLYKDFKEVVLTLTHNVTQDVSHVHIDALKRPYQLTQSPLTVQAWLNTLKDNGLPVTPGRVKLSRVMADTMNAYQAGYHIDVVSRTQHYTNTLPREDKPDLRLTRNGVNGDVAYEQLMVTVNDLFHLTDGDKDALYVMDGGISGLLSNRCDVGLFRLGRLGELSFIRITDEQILKLNDAHQMADKAYVKLNTDLTGQSVALVLGGYLHLSRDLVTRVGSDIYQIDFANLPLLERLYESRDRIDLSSVWDTLDPGSSNDAHLEVNQVFSDETIKAYLKLSQSFFVVIDTPDFFVQETGLELHSLPGTFVINEPPTGLLRTETGLSPTYFMHEERGQWVLNAGSHLRDNRLLETYPYQQDLSVDDTRYYFQRQRPMSFYLQHVGRETLT